jgi:hypothetical protein
MVVELLLLSGLAASAAGIAYLSHYNLKETKAREKRLQKEEAQFRAAVLQELRSPKSRAFRISEFSAKCEMPQDVAVRVADEIYGSLFQKVIADGTIDARKREKLSWICEALEIDAGRTGLIEMRAKQAAYERAVDGVLADGEITGEEAASLELLRQRLGISDLEATKLTADVSRSAYLTTFRRIIRDRRITSEEQRELLRWKQALALSDDQANAIIRTEALALYNQWFASVIQDGIITEEEEAGLTWLQEWAGIRKIDIEHHLQRMQKVKRLALYREGKLPSVRTRRILEGGETCHWESPCTFMYQTRTRSVRATGDLMVTSKHLFFISPAKNVTFRPSRILDIIKYANCLEISVSAAQGSGQYHVPDTEELEAILAGVVRKHKFLLSESYSSAKSRHIPDDVKREVWDRDNGRCVRCSAVDYLEFDHIIPHTRGGANSVKNVQLLCRKCNLSKSDRI